MDNIDFSQCETWRPRDRVQATHRHSEKRGRKREVETRANSTSPALKLSRLAHRLYSCILIIRMFSMFLPCKATSGS